MTGSDHSDKEFRETRNLYVSMMSLYELADKLFGATYVAFMRAQDLSIAQISNLFSIQQILQAVLIILREQSRIRSVGRKLRDMDLLCGERGFCCMRLQ